MNRLRIGGALGAVALLMAGLSFGLSAVPVPAPHTGWASAEATEPSDSPSEPFGLVEDTSSSGYVALDGLKDLLAEHGLQPRSLTRPVLEDDLANATFLALTGITKPHVSTSEEVSAIVEWLRDGGSLFFIGDLSGVRGWNDLSAKLGVGYGEEVEPDHAMIEVYGEHPITSGLGRVVFFRGRALDLCGPQGIAFTGIGSSPPGLPVLSVATLDRGRIVAIGDGNAVDDWGISLPGVSNHWLLQRIVGWLLQDQDPSEPTGGFCPEAGFALHSELGRPVEGLNLTFDGAPSTDLDGTVVSFHWDFGDGGTDSGVSVQHAYAAPGIYDVTLTVTDDDGLSGSVTVAVEVIDLLQLAIQLQQEIDALNGQVQSTQHDLRATQRELRDTRENLSAALQSLQDAHGALTEAQNALQAMQSALDGAYAELSDSRDALAAAQVAIAELDGKVLFLLALQGVVVASVAFLVLYRNLRGRPRSGAEVATKSQKRSAAIQPWPSPEAAGPAHLTSKERILLHLLDFPSYEGRREVPPEVTQRGIGERTGIQLRHFSQYVRPLREEGLVQESTARVTGILQRRKVYALTENGRHQAINIRDRIRSATVRVRGSTGVREETFADVLEQVGQSRSLLEIVREAMETGVVDLRLR